MSPDLDAGAKPALKPLAQEAHERIIALILGGELKSGDLLQEAALGALFGMSRTPVREAIKRLESEGLAAPEGRFIRVRSVTPEDVEEIFFLRLQLEPVAVRSAVRLPLAQIEAMEARVRALMASEPSSTVVQRQTDQDFHHLLCQEFGNQAITQTITALQRRTCIFDYSQVPERFLRGCAEHLEILAALRAGAAERAEELLRRHLEGARDAVIAKLQRARPVAD